MPFSKMTLCEAVIVFLPSVSIFTSLPSVILMSDILSNVMVPLKVLLVAVLLNLIESSLNILNKNDINVKR